ncbi:MAG: AgmX/PglI C-terminal domain-containing protein [Pseudomonadota bacterium]
MAEPATPLAKGRKYHPAVRVLVETNVVLGTLPARGRHTLSRERLLHLARSRGYWPFRRCYEAALRKDPGVEGHTRVRMTIGDDGDVTAARLLETKLPREEGAACLVRAVRALSFDPAPRRRIDVDVTIKLWPGDAPPPPAPEPEENATGGASTPSVALL